MPAEDFTHPDKTAAGKRREPFSSAPFFCMLGCRFSSRNRIPKNISPSADFPSCRATQKGINYSNENAWSGFVERRRGRPVGRIYTASFRFMLQESVKSRFLAACEKNDEEASTVLRKFMAQYTAWSELDMGYRAGMRFTFIHEPEQLEEGR